MIFRMEPLFFSSIIFLYQFLYPMFDCCKLSQSNKNDGYLPVISSMACWKIHHIFGWNCPIKTRHFWWEFSSSHLVPASCSSFQYLCNLANCGNSSGAKKRRPRSMSLGWYLLVEKMEKLSFDGFSLDVGFLSLVQMIWEKNQMIVGWLLDDSMDWFSRENLHRKPWFFPFFIWCFPVSIFPWKPIHWMIVGGKSWQLWLAIFRVPGFGSKATLDVRLLKVSMILAMI